MFMRSTYFPGMVIQTDEIAHVILIEADLKDSGEGADFRLCLHMKNSAVTRQSDPIHGPADVIMETITRELNGEKEQLPLAPYIRTEIYANKELISPQPLVFDPSKNYEWRSPDGVYIFRTYAIGEG